MKFIHRTMTVVPSTKIDRAPRIILKAPPPTTGYPQGCRQPSLMEWLFWNQKNDKRPAGIRKFGGAVHQGIGDKRSLLAEEMLRYFGETCPTLAARCRAAIVRLPALARREAADRLQDFAAVTKETNLELSAACAAVSGEQTTNEFLFDRALASIEHLSELAEETTRWIDELLSGAAGRN